MRKALRYLFAAAILLSACGKDDISGDSDPVITILSPTSGQMISAGDSVSIDVTITDDDMHEFEVLVARAADTSVHYFEEDMDTHDDNVHYTTKFEVPAVSGHTDVMLFVHAEDHDGNESDRSVTFAFMP